MTKVNCGNPGSPLVVILCFFFELVEIVVLQQKSLFITVDYEYFFLVFVDHYGKILNK